MTWIRAMLPETRYLSYYQTDASAATQVTLEWSPNSEPDLEGNKVFVREKDNLMITSVHPRKA